MARKNYSLGVVLLVVAFILLLGKLGVFSFIGVHLWPLLVIGLGLLLHWLYFSRHMPPTVLIPGGALVTYGVLFFICTLFGWGLMSSLWPVFILGIAVGLYEVSMFERQTGRSFLTASIVLGLVSVGLFVLTLLVQGGVYMIIILLILAGVYMIFRKPRLW
ncbi:hypothetical protein NV379_04705 [Paenibacillus sp. N1-5-1-14]|uniref:hypothetical protein n=1 Tax=Paenibacillus radicibacter TaxID=2972488 RepID=UPI002158A1A8|nr:hypothetical protein [Paenibacillus radicibacter]MCR8641951.1 hypothetical protein [Paenibacillus radicibacter]